MFGSIGFPELLMIFIVALLLFGPKQLPHLGRALGRALAEFRRASNDLQRTLEEEVRAEELRELGKEAQTATGLSRILREEEQPVTSGGASADVDRGEGPPSEVPERDKANGGGS